jgi:hypothetical protein
MHDAGVGIVVGPQELAILFLRGREVENEAHADFMEIVGELGGVLANRLLERQELHQEERHRQNDHGGNERQKQTLNRVFNHCFFLLS